MIWGKWACNLTRFTRWNGAKYSMKWRILFDQLAHIRKWRMREEKKMSGKRNDEIGLFNWQELYPHHARTIPSTYKSYLFNRQELSFQHASSIPSTCKFYPFNRQISSFHRFTDSNSERLSTLFKLSCDWIDNETTHNHIGGNKWMAAYSVNRLSYWRGGIMESFKPFV